MELLATLLFVFYNPLWAKPVCPKGTEFVTQKQTAYDVEYCAKKVGVCPDNENLEIVTQQIKGVAECWLAHGPVTYRNFDNSKLEMHFTEGYQDGESISYSAEGKKTLEEKYKNGVRVGRRIQYDINGAKKVEENYEKGLLEGEASEWYPNGMRLAKYFHKKGKREGSYEVWYENGSLKIKANYLLGQWNGKYSEWFSQGKLFLETTYEKGVLHGEYKIFNRNGTKRSVRSYKDGLMQRKFIEWDDSGNKMAESTYENGILVDFGFKSAQQIKTGKKNRLLAEVMELVNCTKVAGVGMTGDSSESKRGCIKGDFDGNGYLDNVVLESNTVDKSRVILVERDYILKEYILDENELEIYSARAERGQFGEPSSPRDGLVVWGKGSDTRVYLFDFDQELFVKSLHASDM